MKRRTFISSVLGALGLGFLCKESWSCDCDEHTECTTYIEALKDAPVCRVKPGILRAVKATKRKDGDREIKYTFSCGSMIVAQQTMIGLGWLGDVMGKASIEDVLWHIKRTKGRVIGMTITGEDVVHVHQKQSFSNGVLPPYRIS